MGLGYEIKLIGADDIKKTREKFALKSKRDLLYV